MSLTGYLEQMRADISACSGWYAQKTMKEIPQSVKVVRALHINVLTLQTARIDPDLGEIVGRQ